MASDVISGMTNNVIQTSMHGTGNFLPYGSHPNDYMWTDYATPNGFVCMDAWAEFFSAQMTRDTDALASNYYYFPKTCDTLEEFASDMLKYYKDQLLIG